jgi:hypothetical protein
MKTTLVWFCLMIASGINGKEVMASIYYGDVGPPGHDEVQIAEVGIIMPLGRMLLVKKGSEYCAIKFTKAWSENTSEVGSIFVASGSDEYAIYESYYQGDKTGDFSKNNVKFKEDKLSFPKPRGIGRLAFSFGNREINCGSIKLFWSGGGSVHFYGEGQDQGDYGIELAPTNWSSISEVDVSDSRLRWYRFDDKRKRKNIKLNELSQP